MDPYVIASVCKDCAAGESAHLIVGLLAGLIAGWFGRMIWSDDRILGVDYTDESSEEDTEDEDNEEEFDRRIRALEEENAQLRGELEEEAEDPDLEDIEEDFEDDLDEDEAYDPNVEAAESIAALQSIVMMQTMTVQQLVQHLTGESSELAEPTARSIPQPQSQPTTQSAEGHDVEYLSNPEAVVSAAVKMDPNFEAAPGDDELAMLFEEEHQRQTRSVQETLDVGRRTGKEPVKYYASRGGGYATIREINQAREEADKFKEKRLSRADELDIMHTFSNIRNMNYHQALGVVEEQGYTLHPIYINNGPKTKATTYCGTTIGVCVTDPDFDVLTGGVQGLSKRAVITSVVDVGGQDPNDRGRVSVS